MQTSTLSDAALLRAQRAARHHAATEGSHCRTCRQRGRSPPTPTCTRACRASRLLDQIPIKNRQARERRGWHIAALLHPQGCQLLGRDQGRAIASLLEDQGRERFPSELMNRRKQRLE